MAKELDVYRDWLSITETARPLNHYQLLRLKSFEDTTVVESTAELERAVEARLEWLKSYSS